MVVGLSVDTEEEQVNFDLPNPNKKPRHSQDQFIVGLYG